MIKEELQMFGFEIVVYVGDVRSILLKVLKEVCVGNFENMEAVLKSVDENLIFVYNV